MEIWNKLQTIIMYNLTFTKVKKGYNIYPETTGKIYFYNEDISTRGGGYIDLYTSTCYYKPTGDVPFTVTRLTDSSKVVEFNTPVVLGTYDSVNTCFNYLFWSESMNNPNTGETNIIIKEHTEYRRREKEQVKPTDDSQDWTDTGNYRDDPDFEPIVDSCHCSTEFRWLLNGTICDGVNKCKKYRLQRKIDCDSEWEDIRPEIDKIGEVIEYDSSECGTYEYKEEWDDTPYCGSELNEKYGYHLVPTNKYKLKYAYIKKIDSDTWEIVDCGIPLGYELLRENSFECGWIGTKEESTVEEDLCGSVVKEKYPTLTNIVETNKYDVYTIHHFETEPYPTNTDDMLEDEWVWKETGITYSATTVEANSCDCGYFYLQWDAVEEYSCGSALGSGYTETTKYQKYIENKYCGGNLLEPSGNIEWRVSDDESCECGYRISGYSIDESVGYEYVCGTGIEGLDEGYMYYKTYLYRECVDGSNREYDKSNIRYEKPRHSTVEEEECEYDESLSANTTLVVTRYRTYYDENEGDYKKVDCDGYVILNVTRYPLSSDCGYSEKWIASGTVCCGNIEYVNPLELNIVSTRGDWTVENNKFTSNTISGDSETLLKVEFSLNFNADVYINYDISSEANFDKFFYSDILPINNEDINPSRGGVSGEKTGQYKISNVSRGYHIIFFKYQKDSGTDTGRDNVIVTLTAERTSCTEFAKYEAEYFTYSVDNGENWITPQPTEWRYGRLLETNSEECGYVPTLEHWILVCPDITYDTAVSGDSCTVCENYNGAPTMFAIEKKQISYDGGKTWNDVIPLETRTEKILKWKADKCGYTGDITENRWTDEYCNGKDLYGTRTTWVSSDNGVSWKPIPESATIEIKEKNSPQCQGEEGGA